MRSAARFLVEAADLVERSAERLVGLDLVVGWAFRGALSVRFMVLVGSGYGWVGAEDGHHGPVEVHGFSFGQGPDRLGSDRDSGVLIRVDRVCRAARRGWEDNFGDLMASGVVEREPAVAIGPDVPTAFMDHTVMGGTEHEEIRPVGGPSVGPVPGVMGSKAAPLGAAREPGPPAQIEERVGLVEREAHPTIARQSAGSLRRDGMTIEFAAAGGVFTQRFDIDIADDFNRAP